MKIFRVLMFLLVGLTLLFAATKVLANKPDRPNEKQTPATKTLKDPEKATPKTHDKSAKPAGKPDDKQTPATKTLKDPGAAAPKAPDKPAKQ